jgi:hypothetical protein
VLSDRRKDFFGSIERHAAHEMHIAHGNSSRPSRMHRILLAIWFFSVIDLRDDGYLNKRFGDRTSIGAEWRWRARKRRSFRGEKTP